MLPYDSLTFLNTHRCAPSAFLRIAERGACAIVATERKKKMPLPCSVCRRPDRTAINKAIRHGEAMRAVARRYGVSKSTMTRHAAHVQRSEEGELRETASQERVTVAAPTEEQLAAVLARVGQLELDNTTLRVELGKQAARSASQERRFGEIEAWVHGLAGQVGRHGQVVTTVQDLLELLRENDDCWQTMSSMLSTSSLATRGVLHQWVASQVGRPRPLKYIRQ
jgi:transposase-like protein